MNANKLKIVTAFEDSLAIGAEVQVIEVVPSAPTATTLIYVQGVGHVSHRYAALREQLKALVKELNASLGLDNNLSWNITNEDTGRVQIIVSGLNKSEISRQKIAIANHLRKIYPGIRVFNSKTRGYSIWNCYFSDGNFNTYAGGVEFDMEIAAE